MAGAGQPGRAQGRRDRTSERGETLLELTIAFAVVSIMSGVSLTGHAGQSAVLTAEEQRTLALQELSGHLEQCYATSADLAAGDCSLTVGEAAARRLEGARAERHIRVEEAGLLHVDVELTWGVDGSAQTSKLSALIATEDPQ